jgi:hypothetical protein
MSIGNKTLNELEHLASQRGWKKGPLTFAKIQRMTADEADWQSRVNAEEFKRAYNEKNTEAANKRTVEDSKAQRMWKDEASAEETEAALAEVTKFVQAHPHFVASSIPNREALVDWLRFRSMPVTAQNLATAFQALGAEGKILINPSAIGIGTETEIGGARLKHHPELYRLLEPAPNAEQKAKIAEQKMSSKEFRELHKEDWREPQISTRQRESWNKAIGFFLESRPDCKSSEANLQKIGVFITANGLTFNPQGLEAAYKSLKSKNELELNEGAVQEGQALRYTNLAGTGGNVKNVQTALPEKESLAYKVNSMTAKEYQNWLQNPANRRAIDGAVAAR